MPRPHKHTQVDLEHYVHKSLSTGIFEWQELAQVDFQELFQAARKRSAFANDQFVGAADFF